MVHARTFIVGVVAAFLVTLWLGDGLQIKAFGDETHFHETSAMFAGHFPLVLASGPGAGARNSIGIVLVSGMIIGTLFTLFVLPAIYMLIAHDQNKSKSHEVTQKEIEEMDLEAVEA